MLKSLHLTGLLMAVALAPGARGHALSQGDPKHQCWAPPPSYSERADWYDAEGRFVRDTNIRSIPSLVLRFAGTYRLLVITSEGGLEKEVAEYNLKLAPPTRAQREKIGQIGAVASGRLQVPLVAVLNYKRAIVGQRGVKDRSGGNLSGE
jgi:hypothetical protein